LVTGRSIACSEAHEQRQRNAADGSGIGYALAVSEMRYKAFISYSHRDRKWGIWLQHALERYRIPRRLVGSESTFGPIPARLAPVFRDREDLSSAADLSMSVKESLESSESLVVICSPTSAASDWVSEEISYFQGLGRHDRVFALIVDGDPQAEDPAQRCFPKALTSNPDGTPREPLAADARKLGDGKLLARLKLVAGILGIRLDELRRRDMQRRQRLWMLSMGAAVAISMVMTVLAVMAISARNAAENRRDHAEELVGYMVLKTRATRSAPMAPAPAEPAWSNRLYSTMIWIPPEISPQNCWATAIMSRVLSGSAVSTDSVRAVADL